MTALNLTHPNPGAQGGKAGGLRLRSRVRTSVRHGFRAGLTLFETTMVLIIAIFAMTLGASIYSDYLKNQSNQVTAQQMVDVSRAFAKYMQDNYAHVLNEAGPTGLVNISIDELKPDYISESFKNMNPFGQEYVFAARKPDPTKNMLEAIVYTRGGDAIEPNRALAISQMIGASGGFTLKDGDEFAVRSTFDGFDLNLADYDANPGGSGKLVSALFLNEMGMIATDFLYRNAVPGHPELNRMNTSIDMGGNSLNNTDTVNAVRANVAGEVVAGGVTASGDVRGNNLIATDAVYGNNFTAYGGVTAGHMFSHGDIATNSQVRGNTVRANGRLSGGEYLQLDGTANLGWGCEGNLIARNAEGKVLTCQGGIWKNGLAFNDVTTTEQYRNTTQTVHLGQKFFCALTWFRSDDEDDSGECRIYRDGDYWYMYVDTRGWTWCAASCF